MYLQGQPSAGRGSTGAKQVSFKLHGYRPDRLAPSQKHRLTKPRGAKAPVSRLAVYELDGHIAQWKDQKKGATNTVELMVLSPAPKFMRLTAVDLLGKFRGFRARFIRYAYE